MRLFVADFRGWDLLVFLFMAPFSRCLEYERCNSAARTRASAFCMPQTGHLVIFWRLTAYPQSTDHRAFSNIYTDVSSLSKYFYAYEYHTHEYDTRKHKNVENLIGLAAYWHWDELRFRKPANSI